jgi:hypothetical protein
LKPRRSGFVAGARDNPAEPGAITATVPDLVVVAITGGVVWLATTSCCCDRCLLNVALRARIML